MWYPGLISFFMAMCLAGHDVSVDAAGQAKTARARTLLHLLIDGKYREFADAGNAKMKAAMSAQKAEQIWTGITSQIGPYRSEVSATLTRVQGFYSVRFVCLCERGKVTLRIVVDGEDRLSGLWFDGVDRDVAYTPPEYVDVKAFREEKVTVSAGQFPLPGTLTLPKAAGHHPAVVLVHGSGPLDEDETVGGCKPFRDLAWGLASRGIAVLRYEKRTHKHPTATRPADWTLDAETIDDAVAAVNVLRKCPEIDAKRIYVAGHSLGGMAAPFIATRDGKLAGIIIMAGTPRSILDVVRDQIDYQAGLGGTLDEKTQTRVREAEEALAAIRAGKLEGASEKLGMPAAYLARLDKLDTGQAAAKLKIPILIIQGKRDCQATQKDFDAWKKVLANRKNVTFKLYDRLNHLFVAGEGPSTGAEYAQPGHVDTQVVTDIADWLNRPTR